MNVLIVTPMPTHPATQGSRQRCFDIARAFQRQGAGVTLLYWAAEGLEPGAVSKMETAWEDLQIVSCDGHVNRRTYPEVFGIDDWYHGAIGARIKALCAERRFDVCVVNYVWLSRALLAVPDDCVRIIDTHDLFGGRAEKFRALGREPEWYYTSVDEETKGLNRADFAIAIQKSEAEELYRRTRSEVVEVGYLAAATPVQRRRDSEQNVVMGYIGSDNPFNISSIEKFCRALNAHSMPRSVRMVAGGSICDFLRTVPGQPFALLGKVDKLKDFYGSIDIALNPMVGGTGLKIKTIEALSFGVGVVATEDAFVGIETDFNPHKFETVVDMAEYLVRLSKSKEQIEILRRRSVDVFAKYSSQHPRYFADLYQKVYELRTARLNEFPTAS